MADRPLERVRQFLAELRRRKVYRVAAVYATVAFVVVQAANLVFPALNIPPWGYSLVVVLALLGFPVAVVLAWAFEISPEGRTRPTPSEDAAAATHRTGFRWLVGALVLIAVGAAGTVAVGDIGPGAGSTDSTPESAGEVPSASAEGSGKLELSPRRVAVLYFDAFSPDDSLAAFARGLTENLIHQLDQAEQLEVVSRHGVRPFRDGTVGLDSIARRLRAGSIVEGSVQEVRGDSVRVTVQLIDGQTQAHLMSRQLTRPVSDPVRLQEEVAREVSHLLRRRLGDDLRLESLKAEASSPRAWRKVQRAERLREDAKRLRREDSGEGAAALVRQADSLLAEAGSLDSTWSEPLVARARLAEARVNLFAPSWTREERAEIRRRLEFADRAVRRDGRSVGALVIRGRLRFWLSRHLPDQQRARALLASAEEDLREAVRLDPSSARGWYALSVLLHEGRGEREEARYAAERAREADSFFRLEPRLMRGQLFKTAINEPDYEDAVYWCELGRKQHPESPLFRDCELILLASAGGPTPDVSRAHELVKEIASRASESTRPFYTAVAWRQYAAVLARAGRSDSARSVLEGAPEAGPAGALRYEEAHVHLLLGEEERALEDLRRMLEEMPRYRPRVREDPWFAPLRENPRFRKLVGAGDGEAGG